jgi:hypothetical protein
MDLLRAAVDTVTWQRNSGNGCVSSADIDALLDAASSVLPPLPACEVCGSTSRPRRRSADPDPRVPQVVCRDMQACGSDATAEDDLDGRPLCWEAAR